MFGLATRDARTNRSDSAANGRWENEGGATPAAGPVGAGASLGAAEQPSPAVRASEALDTRQQELMAVESSDGRPPSRRQRIFEWRWLGVAAILIVVGIAAWVAFRGISWGAAVAGLGLAVLLLVGAGPVLAAGMIRGQEERTARKHARLERQGCRGR